MGMPEVPAGGRPKGRPRAGRPDHLIDRLIAAAEQGLAQRVYSELTTKQIAEAAGTTEGMIQYYFGSKDRLSLAVLEKAVDDVSNGIRKLKKEILDLPGNPTLHLIRELFRLSEPHAATTRLHAAEMLRQQSAIKEVCARPNHDVFGALKDLIQHLIDAGVYSRRLDPGLATFTVMCLLESPVIHAAAMRDRGLNEADFGSDAWLGFCAGLLDRQFRDPWNPAEAREGKA
jgi:AcrR family transcriptional regulator